MYFLPIVLAIGIVFGAMVDLRAAPLSAAGVPQAGESLVLVQAKPAKDETIKQKAKRVWKNIAGYKFAVACPAFPVTLSTSTCTETGKSRDDARGKCQAKNTFCRVSDAR